MTTFCDLFDLDDEIDLIENGFDDSIVKPVFCILTAIDDDDDELYAIDDFMDFDFFQ